MEKIAAFDEFLIYNLEKLTHKFQKLTGKTNYWLAKQVAILEFIAWFWICINPIFSEANNELLFKIIGSLVILTVYSMTVFARIYHTIFKLDSIESEAFRRLESGLANPQKSNYEIIRRTTTMLFSALFMTIVGTVQVSMSDPTYTLHVAITLFIIGLYLIACDPLPPGTSKIREWLNSFKPAPKLVEAKSTN